MLRVVTIAFALALLAAAPASSRLEAAPTFAYRVTAGAMQLETRKATGFERLTWSVAPHARGTRPAPGFPTADGSGALKSFQLRFPVRGTYTYEHHEEASGHCKETFAFAPESRGTAAALQVGSRVRISWGLDPRRRAGYAAPACRPQTNNARLYFLAHQRSLTVDAAADNLGKTTFTITARGTQTSSEATVTWRLTLSVRRLGRR